jgi:hypothetical protein
MMVGLAQILWSKLAIAVVTLKRKNALCGLAKVKTRISVAARMSGSAP